MSELYILCVCVHALMWEFSCAWTDGGTQHRMLVSATSTQHAYSFSKLCEARSPSDFGLRVLVCVL